MYTSNLRSIFLLLSSIFLFQNCSEAPSKAADHVAGTGDLPTKMTEFAKTYQQKVAPAMDDLNVPYEKATHQSDQRQTISFDNGSTVEIPEHAFVDESGQIVTGVVDIEYREIKSTVDMIASGIPMRYYDQTQEEQWMETAGMFEIKGSKDGKPVFIANGKSLVVRMTSDEGGAGFDNWYFDAEIGNWVNLGYSEPEENKTKLTAEQAVRTLERDQEAPIRPIRFDEQKSSLNLNIDYQDFPELADKRKIVWQFNGKDEEQNPDNNPWISSVDWEEVQLAEGKVKGEYQLTLQGGTKSYSIPVVASLKGQEYEAAMAAYQSRMKDYKRWQAKLNSAQNHAVQQARFVRSMQVQNFGIYNCDRLWNAKDAVILAADFDFGDEQSNNMKHKIKVFLITREGRSVIQYPSYTWETFKFDPKQENKLVAILPGNRMATFSAEDFAEEMENLNVAEGSSYTFKMNAPRPPVSSLDELEEAYSLSSDD